jgi:hypothetical protein
VRRQHLESTVTIRRPLEDVWAFMIDLFNSPRVRGMMLGARKVSPGPFGLGTVVDNRTVLLGFETHMRFTVIEWDPPHAVVASMSGPLLRSGRVATELLGTSEGTRRLTRLDLELSPGGILRWPLLGRLLKRDQARADRKQKALLEAGTLDTAAGKTTMWIDSAAAVARADRLGRASDRTRVVRTIAPRSSHTLISCLSPETRNARPRPRLGLWEDTMQHGEHAPRQRSRNARLSAQTRQVDATLPRRAQNGDMATRP